MRRLRWTLHAVVGMNVAEGAPSSHRASCVSWLPLGARSAARELRPVTTIVGEKGRSAADMASPGARQSLILRL